MQKALDSISSAISRKKGSIDKRIKILQHTPFFQYLTIETTNEFAQCFPSTIHADPGKSISLDPTKIYIVAEGEIDLSASFPDTTGGSKVEAHGYLCRKRRGDIVNICEAKKDIAARMQSSSKSSHLLKDLAEDILITADTNTLLLCGDMSALDEFNKTHPEASKPIVEICTSQIEDRLMDIPFLQEISKSKLSVLAAMCRYEAYDSGQTVFEEGGNADKLFLVIEGVAEVIANSDMSSSSSSSEQCMALKRSFACSSSGDDCRAEDLLDEASQHIPIAKLKRGDYFGETAQETALAFNIERTCGVRTVDKCLFLTVHKTDFDNYQKICPDIEESLQRVIKQRMVSKLSSLGIPFLNGISDDMIHSLAKSVTIEEVDNGHVVFQQGDVGNRFYIIVHGSVRVDATNTCSDENDGEHDQATTESVENIGSLHEGQYFGEMALLKDCQLRTATVMSTQKSILLSIDKESFTKLFGSNSNIHAEFELRVLKDGANLKHILAHECGVISFREFLEAEHAGENIDFWVAVGKYQALFREDESNLDKRRDAAKYIFVTFCADFADRQVNIPHRMLVEIDTRLHKEDVGAAPDLFDDAKREILSLMMRDNFSRYKRSDMFKTFLTRLGIL